MRRLRLTTALLVATLSVAITACSSASNSNSGASSTASSKDAPSQVTLVHVEGYLSAFAVQQAAEGTGALTAVGNKFGTSVNLQDVGTGADALAALISGSGDGAILNASQLMKAVAAGQKLEAVFDTYLGGTAVLVGAKKYEKTRGTDLAAYNGSTWGYTSEGSATELYMEATAEAAGVNFLHQSRIATGGLASEIPALESGRVDIASVDAGTAGEMVSSGIGYVVFNQNDLTKAEPIVGQQIGNALVFRTDFIQKYPQLVQAIVDAFYSSLERIKAVTTNPQAVLKLFTAPAQQALSSGWATGWALQAPALVGLDGSFTPQQIQDTINFSEKYNLITAADAKSAPQAFNNTFVDKAKGGA
jgi:NitT/TauT family transport system substrate-binding protein